MISLSFSESSGVPKVNFNFSDEDGSVPRSKILDLWVLLCAFDSDVSEGVNSFSLEFSSFLRAYDAVVDWLDSEDLTVGVDANLQSRLDRWFEQIDVGLEPKSFGGDPMQLLASTNWDTDPVSGRVLTNNQVRDLKKLLASQNGANFSVPGAGKTTVLLALHEILKQEKPLELIVVAPGNAFGAWSDVTRDCLKSHSDQFQRLVSGKSIPEMLKGNAPFRLISYKQLTVKSAEKALKNYMLRNPVHLVLDESHRIKNPVGLSTTVVQNLSPYAVRRDILSGTPIPNSLEDLKPQVDFLFPGFGLSQRLVDVQSANSLTEKFRVRTRYSELNIPKPVPEYFSVPMSDNQRVVYALLAKKALKQMRLDLRGADVSATTRNSVSQLLMLSIDPALVARQLIKRGEAKALGIEHICLELAANTLGPKASFAADLARAHVSEGRKVVLWSPFTASIRSLENALKSHGAQVINGEVSSGTEDDEGSREFIIRRFHEDPSAMVLIANPAAGGEGISLHKASQTAIYLGRTYNAAHYMQSRDRISRLGMPAGAKPILQIIESSTPSGINSVDLSVRRRLDAKVRVMGEVLDDPDLRTISFESEHADPNLDDGLSYEDIEDLVLNLGEIN